MVPLPINSGKPLRLVGRGLVMGFPDKVFFSVPAAFESPMQHTVTRECLLTDGRNEAKTVQ